MRNFTGKIQLLLSLFSIFGLLLWGCSHGPALAPTPAAVSATDWANTSIDIQYTLGHSHRRLLMEAANQEIRAQTLIEGTALKQSQLDPSGYHEFLSKVRDFMLKRRSLASASSPSHPDPGTCRSPYTVVIKSHQDTQEIQGCRMSDEGAFSHLVKDGEFLIYRQK